MSSVKHRREYDEEIFEQNRQYRNKKHHYDEDEFELNEDEMDPELYEYCKKYLK